MRENDTGMKILVNPTENDRANNVRAPVSHYFRAGYNCDSDVMSRAAASLAVRLRLSFPDRTIRVISWRICGEWNSWRKCHGATKC